MNLVAIESPYAGEVDRNVRYARRAVADALSRGEAPIASHLLYTQDGVLDDGVPVERAHGISAGLCWAEKADYVVFYVDWGWSAGMTDARVYYDKISMPYRTRSIGRGGSR